MSENNNINQPTEKFCLLIEKGKLIRKVRETKKITIEQLAKEINVEPSIIQDLEAGALDDASIRVKIDNCLGIGHIDNSNAVPNFDDPFFKGL